MWQSMTIMVKKEALEAFQERLFKDSNFCAMHAKRSTLFIQNNYLTHRIQGRMEDWHNVNLFYLTLVKMLKVFYFCYQS